MCLCGLSVTIFIASNLTMPPPPPVPSFAFAVLTNATKTPRSAKLSEVWILRQGNLIYHQSPSCLLRATFDLNRPFLRSLRKLFELRLCYVLHPGASSTPTLGTISCSRAIAIAATESNRSCDTCLAKTSQKGGRMIKTGRDGASAGSQSGGAST